jgi:hypothetical protein
LPLVTGLAGLAAMVWIAWLTRQMRWPFLRLPARRVLIGLLLAWVAVKLAFVQVMVPRREHGREPQAKGQQLASLVPPGEPLYLFKLKDEGIMFYYGRQICRLSDLSDLPARGTPKYCILVEAEWQDWPSTRPADMLLQLCDEQRAPIFLVKTCQNGEGPVPASW